LGILQVSPNLLMSSPALLLLASPAFAISCNIASLIQSRGYVASSAFIVSGLMPALTCVICFLFNFSDLLMFTYCVVIAMWTVAIGCFIWLLLYCGVYAPASVDLWLMHKKSVPLWFSSATVQGGVWLPPILLAIMASTSEVAIFTVAARISMVFNLILASLNSVIAHRVAQAYSSGSLDGTKVLVAYSLRLVWILCIALALFILFFSELILGVFGTKLIAAEGVLAILIIGQLTSVFFGPVGLLLLMTDNRHEYLVAVFSGLFVMVTLSVLLIPLHGAFGASIAVALSLGVQNLAANFYVKKILGWLSYKLVFTRGLPANFP
jgi:O-antigen/teichoic acid export membrane protein